MIDEGQVLLDMDDVEKDTQQENANPFAEVDQETLALAMALKKAKEDPATAELFRQVIGGGSPATAPNQPPAQPQVSAEEKQLEEIRTQIRNIEDRLRTLTTDSEEYGQLMNQLAMLKLDEAKLEPVVRLKRELQPLRQNQAQAALWQWTDFARKRIDSDPILSQKPEAARTALARVEEGLNDLFNRAPDQLVLPQVRDFIEAIVRSVAYDVTVPSPPHDAGGNAGRSTATPDVPKELLEAAQRRGVKVEDIIEYAKRFGGGVNG